MFLIQGRADNTDYIIDGIQQIDHTNHQAKVDFIEGGIGSKKSDHASDSTARGWDRLWIPFLWQNGKISFSKVSFVKIDACKLSSQVPHNGADKYKFWNKFGFQKEEKPSKSVQMSDWSKNEWNLCMNDS